MPSGDNKIFEDFIQSQLSDFEAEPPVGGWDRIKADIPEPKRRMPLYFPFLSIHGYRYFKVG